MLKQKRLKKRKHSLTLKATSGKQSWRLNGQRRKSLIFGKLTPGHSANPTHTVSGADTRVTRFLLLLSVYRDAGAWWIKLTIKPNKYRDDMAELRRWWKFVYDKHMVLILPFCACVWERERDAQKVEERNDEREIIPLYSLHYLYFFSDQWCLRAKS